MSLARPTIMAMHFVRVPNVRLYAGVPVLLMLQAEAVLHGWEDRRKKGFGSIAFLEPWHVLH